MDKLKLPLHKREELKRKEDEKRAQEVYQEFVATFEDEPKKIGKTFVRGEVVNSNAPGSKPPKPGSAARLYKPAPTLFKPTPQSPLDAAKRAAEEKARKIMEEAMRSRPDKIGKKKEPNKRTSNLESFKEELKRAQEERAERRKLRQQLQDHLGIEKEPLDRIAPSLDNPYLGTYDTDPSTTNLFLSNLSPKLTEDDLCRTFGHYGPLASVKIMWPRTDEERARGYNTGFIAFMTRKDAERAVNGLKGKIIMNYEMKLSWGKSVPVPPNPVFIPPRMLEMALPPPPSGLPFNAQPRPDDRIAYKWPLPPPGAPPPTDPEQREAWEKMLRNAVIKVVIPTERQLLCTIHRVIEFAVREGPMFEAVLMNRELNNPFFRFLFDNQSPSHVYYRWKLYSILMGESPNKWSTKEFRLFENGSTWYPPPMNFFQQGLPKELYDEDEEINSPPSSSYRESRDDEYLRSEHEDREIRERDRDRDRDRERDRDRDRDRDRERDRDRDRDRHRDRDRDSPKDLMPPPSMPLHSSASTSKKGQLSEKQREKIGRLLQELTPDRDKICEAMLYCVDHAEAAEEILDMICESLFDPESTIPRKIAKLYLLSDILANCTAKVANVSYYRKHIGSRLEEIFKHIHEIYAKIEARLKAEQFKQRVMACFRSWEDTAIYTSDFLINLQNIFLGLSSSEPETENKSDGEEPPLRKPEPSKSAKSEADFANTSLFKPLEAAKPSAIKKLVDYDLDGVPLDSEDEKDESEISMESASKKEENSLPEKPAFVKSKWEEVDTEQEEAVTSSKWERFEAAKDEKIFYDEDEDDDIDGIPMEEAAPEPIVSPPSPKFKDPPVSQVSSTSDLMSDEKRLQLREIEVKVMKFQDELESGIRKRSSSMTLVEEVAKYREKLLQKVNKESKSHKSDKKDGSSSKKDRSQSSSSSKKKESKQKDRHSKKSHTTSISEHSTSKSEKEKDKDKSKDKDRENKEKEKNKEKPSKSKKRSRSKSQSKKSKRSKNESSDNENGSKKDSENFQLSSSHSSSSSKHKKKKH